MTLTFSLATPAAGAKATYKVIPPSGAAVISLTSVGLSCHVKDGDGSCTGPAAKRVTFDVQTSPPVDAGGDFLAVVADTEGSTVCYRLDDGVADRETCPGKALTPKVPEPSPSSARTWAGRAVRELTNVDIDLQRAVSKARTDGKPVSDTDIDNARDEEKDAMNDVWEAVTILHPGFWGCADFRMDELFRQLAYAEEDVDLGSFHGVAFDLDQAEKDVALCPGAAEETRSAFYGADALASSAATTQKQGETVDSTSANQLKRKIEQLAALLPSLFGIDNDLLVSHQASFLAHTSRAESAARAQNVNESIAGVEAMISYKQSIETGLRTVATAG